MNKKIYVISAIITLILIINLSNCGGKIMPLSKSWEFAVPHQEVPEGLVSLSAKDCGVCHKKHYEEWKLSTHAHAWTDLQFQAELVKESSPFMCINCHIPLQNQQEYIVEGLVNGDIYKPVMKKNPHFDESLQQEGINCASCHVRNNAVIGPTGTDKAPHKTIKDPEFLSESLCISCHNATAILTPTLVCTFETADEWKAGPYYGDKNCKSCHMESIRREIVYGYGERESHAHYFAGSGIPKFDSVEVKGLNGLAFYPTELNDIYRMGDTLDYTIVLKNEFAGHNVPTGDPERFFNTTFTVKNSVDDVLYAKTERIGEIWEWYPEAKKIGDNNIAPLEARPLNFQYLTEQPDSLIISIVVTKHRLDEESAAYNQLGDNYPLFITVFEEEYRTVVK